MYTDVKQVQLLYDVNLCLCAATMDPESFDRSNYMHRAMIRVAYKFAHKLSVFDMLEKVNT